MGYLKQLIIGGAILAVFVLGIANFSGEITSTYQLSSENFTFVAKSQVVAENLNASLSTFNQQTKDTKSEISPLFGLPTALVQGGSVLLLFGYTMSDFIVSIFTDAANLIGVPSIVVYIAIGLIFTLAALAFIAGVFKIDP